ncbi:delta-like protein, partial [Plakobranchus ocellatus]
MTRSWAIAALVLAQFGALCTGNGVLEVELISLDNSKGFTVSGKRCDPEAGWSWFGPDPKDTGPCDHNLVICIAADIRYSGALLCDLGKIVTETVDDQNVIDFRRTDIGIENPLSFLFDAWPGVVHINIDIHDDDSTGYDFVDRVVYQFKAKEIKTYERAKKRREELDGTYSTVKINVRVYCNFNYYGGNCTTFCEPKDDDVQGHYKCDPKTGAKVCRAGWSGENCTMNPDDCIGNRCNHLATCMDHLGYYTCLCPPGKTGTFCDGEINECLSLPCKNGGTCQDLFNDFSCTCPTGWGGPTCEVEFKPCTNLKCVYGTCSRDEQGEEVCDCDAGYRGEQCDIPIIKCDENPCGENAESCKDVGDDYECKCKTGFAGKNCERQRFECDSQPCQYGGECFEDSVKGYRCECLPGFYGNQCEHKTDECKSSPCQNGGFCIDLHLNYLCICPDFAKGSNCEIRIDKCLSKPCKNGGTCMNLVDSFRCVCEDGEDGECYGVPENFECACAEGFTGRTCEINIDECASEPCQNGGTCCDGINSFTCECPPGFKGPLCDEPSLPLPPTPPKQTTQPSLTSV